MKRRYVQAIGLLAAFSLSPAWALQDVGPFVFEEPINITSSQVANAVHFDTPVTVLVGKFCLHTTEGDGHADIKLSGDPTDGFVLKSQSNAANVSYVPDINAVTWSSSGDTKALTSGQINGGSNATICPGVEEQLSITLTGHAIKHAAAGQYNLTLTVTEDP